MTTRPGKHPVAPPAAPVRAPVRAPARPPAPAAPAAGSLANGRLVGDRVVIEDAAQAARVKSRTSAGKDRPGGSLELALVEAAWLAADGRLAVRDADGTMSLSFAELLAKGGGSAGEQDAGHRAEADYLAYRDLRERGLVVRPTGPGRFQAWPRGTDSGPAAFAMRASSDADGLPVADLLAAAKARDVLCVADADGSVTHYQAALAKPAGDVPEGDLPRAKGAVLADRVLVADPTAAAAYQQREFLGTPQPGGLLLSFVEAEALRRRGVLSVPAGLAGKAPESARILQAHLALRAAGAVPKSGFRFGTHVRAYRAAPADGHAEWLVHCAGAGETLPWPSLSRGVRLAHGVRKSFLVAIPDGEGIVFAQLGWYRP